MCATLDGPTYHVRSATGGVAGLGQVSGGSVCATCGSTHLSVVVWERGSLDRSSSIPAGIEGQSVISWFRTYCSHQAYLSELSGLAAILRVSQGNKVGVNST